MKNIIPSVLIIAIGALLALPVHGADNDRFARLVLFIPADAEPPENYEARLRSLALRTEAFFEKWMPHWNRAIARTTIFARDEDGVITVSLVKGDLLNANGRAALPEIRGKAVKSATAELGLPAQDGTIWWIFYSYPGVKGFQGGANKSGGIAINAYPDAAGESDVTLDLASPALADQNIKGTIHEFGHALGLPHIGPRPKLGLGNSLMGPVNRAFWSKSGGDGIDPRVHLNEAAAAALWKHPIFKKTATAKPKMPAKVQVTDLALSQAADGEQLLVTGQLEASAPAHTAVLLASERGQFGDYWARAYSAPIDPESGAFKITVDEPFATGLLFLSFCFENGVNTADGKKPFQQGSPLVLELE